MLLSRSTVEFTCLRSPTLPSTTVELLHGGISSPGSGTVALLLMDVGHPPDSSSRPPLAQFAHSEPSWCGAGGTIEALVRGDHTQTGKWFRRGAFRRASGDAAGRI